MNFTRDGLPIIVTIAFCFWGECVSITSVRAQEAEPLLLKEKTVRILAGLREINALSLYSEPPEYLHLWGDARLPYPPTESIDLAAIPALRGLEFADHGIEESALQHVGGIKQLEYLRIGDLSDSCRMDGNWLRYLRHLSNLKVLGIHSIDLTDNSLLHLKNLKSLERIELGGGAFSDAAVKMLITLPNLQSLSIRGDFTDQIGPLIAKHSKLQSLEIHGNFTDRFLFDLSKNKNLTELTVLCDKISDVGVMQIADNCTFTQLTFDSKLITDLGVRAIAKNSRLVNLYLESPSITDKSMPDIAKLPLLEGLAFRRSGITDEGVSILAKSSSIERLFIEGSKQLSPVCIASLNNMISLRYADLRSTSIEKSEYEALNKLLHSRTSHPPPTSSNEAFAGIIDGPEQKRLDGIEYFYSQSASALSSGKTQTLTKLMSHRQDHALMQQVFPVLIEALKTERKMLAHRLLTLWHDQCPPPDYEVYRKWWDDDLKAEFKGKFK